MNITRKSRVFGAILSAALAGMACESIVGLDDFRLTSSLSPDAGGDSCVDPAAFDGRGCFRCPPTESSELLNACTTGDCTPFDNAARIPGHVEGEPARPLTPADVAPAPVVTPTPVVEGEPDPLLVRCSELVPRPVYLYGSSALNLGLRTLAQAISETATLVYQNDTSCSGLDAILTGITRLTGTAQYWPPGQEQPLSCSIDGEQLADIGLCDLSPESCVPNFSGSANLVDDIGPAQVFMFTVPKGSTQKSISAEAAYNVFAYDDAGV